jgi:hypothetical protein
MRDLAVLVAQVIDRRSDRRTNGCAVFDLADLDAVEPLFEPVVVERERAHEIRSSGKRDQSDAIVRTFLDEILDHVLHCFEPIDAFAIDQEVHCLHRAGDVDRQQDIDATGLDFGIATHELWPGQRDNERSQRQQFNGFEDTARRALWPGAADTRVFDTWNAHGCSLSAPALQQCDQREQQQQPQEYRMIKVKHGN